jgi:hypothetical protein
MTTAPLIHVVLSDTGPKLTDWLTAVGGFLVFVATAVLAVLAYQQMHKLGEQANTAKEQVEVMRKATADEAAAVREQIAASVALAEATQETADAARQELALLRQQAEAAMRQSEAAEAALQTSVAPFILDVPVHTMRPGPSRLATMEGKPVIQRPDVDVSVIKCDTEHAGGWLAVPIRNVGPGVARVDGAFLALANNDNQNVAAAPDDIPSVVPSGEIGQLLFREDTEHPGRLKQMVLDEDDLIVEVGYSDISGRQRAATMLYLGKLENAQRQRRLRVTEVLPGVDRLLTGRPRR